MSEDIISVSIDEVLGTEQAYAPGASYYKDTYNKIEGSVITEFEEQSLDYGDAEVIGVMIGLISPGGKDKKAQKIYGAVSDTIEDAYKKNKGKIDDAIDYFRKKGVERPGFNDSHEFENRKNWLPKLDGNGEKIRYDILDIDPIPTKGGRNADRVIYGSDGSKYYTDNHYVTIIEIND